MAMPATDKDFYEMKLSRFVRLLGRRAGKVIRYTMLLRLILNCAVHKLNLVKALRDVKPVLGLGLGCGIFNVVYHFVRRIFAQKRKAAAK